MTRKNAASAAAAKEKVAAAAPSGDTTQVSMPRADLTARAAAPSEDPSGRATGTVTVTVALKYSTGLILQGYKMQTFNESTPMGFREVPKAVKVGDPVTVNGTRGHRGSVKIEIVGGFALTQGVPKELWDEWLKVNLKSDIVVNGLIFAHENIERVRAEARERAALRSGMEPITAPTGKPGEKLDPRLERGVETFKRDDAEVMA